MKNLASDLKMADITKEEEDDDYGECPKCHAKIGYLDYKCDITEYGQMVPNDWMESSDTSDADNMEYSCPICGCELEWEEAEKAL